MATPVKETPMVKLGTDRGMRLAHPDNIESVGPDGEWSLVTMKTGETMKVMVKYADLIAGNVALGELVDVTKT